MKYINFCYLVVLIGTFAIGSPFAFASSTNAQQKSSSFGSKSWNIKRWSLTCAARGCFIFLNDSLAGNNTIEIGIDRATRRPVLFGFITNGNAKLGTKLFVVFVKTIEHSHSPGCGGGPDVAKPVHCYGQKIMTKSTFGVPFDDCSNGTCIARIKGQYAITDKSGDRINLLTNISNASSIGYVYQGNDGKPRTAMLDIDGFKDVFNLALKQLQSQNIK